MEGILTRHGYDGDEGVLEQTIRGFLANIDTDDRATERFSYIASRVEGALRRVHLGAGIPMRRWHI